MPGPAAASPDPSRVASPDPSRTVSPDPGRAVSPDAVSPDASHPVGRTLDLLERIFRGVDAQDFAVRLWEGSEWAPAGGSASGGAPPQVTLVLNTPSALRGLLRPHSEAALAQLYLKGDIDIEGDIFAILPVGRAILSRRRGWRELAQLGIRAARLPAADYAVPRSVPRSGSGHGRHAGQLPDAELSGVPHSPARDRAAVTHHYNMSNHFYSLFLGRHMAYSCAIFARPDEDLDSAQLRKLDTICRKLRLQPGQRLLDVGCGWGSLMLHAAQHYGVTAVGITLSERQAELAAARISRAGLDQRCKVELRDYRSLEGEDVFDKVASVGMFEHVGRARAAEYFGVLLRLLRPGGAYLHHAVTADVHAPRKRGPTVTGRFVFPDHELIPIGETLGRAESAGFEVRDVENFREHYALTLRHWIRALETRREEAVADVGEATWRAWRLVFAGSAEGFERKRQGLVQSLLVKPHADGTADLPLGRSDWYAPTLQRRLTAAVLGSGGA
jgi:cyclopropane-fatty-acyl-phospholipid synthase